MNALNDPFNKTSLQLVLGSKTLLSKSNIFFHAGIHDHLPELR
jgi:hypothetical protein